MPRSTSLAASSRGVTRASWTASMGFITSGTRLVVHSQNSSAAYSNQDSAEMNAAFLTDDATGLPARTTKYMRKMGERSARTPDCASAYPPMMAVTAVTSTIGFTAESQLGSSGRRYQIRYCATVQASIGPSTTTFAMFSAADRCGAYIRADAVRRKTTAALR